MNAIALKDKLCQGLREKSGLERRRDYLGMSQISQCPRKLYFDFMDGRQEPGDQQHWFCWTGYVHEEAILKLLGIEKDSLRRQVEVVAEFDARFRGHTDYAGDYVIDVKSVAWDKFIKIRVSWPRQEHVDQMQMYLRHGGWKKGFLVYVARDVPFREFDGPPFWVYEITPQVDLADRLDQKARDILAAIDRQMPPRCECRWCKR